MSTIMNHLTVGVFICVVSVTVQVTASLTDCGDTFQSQLSDMLAIKQSCDSAGFYDCCQVRSYYLILGKLIQVLSSQIHQFFPNSPTNLYIVKKIRFDSPFSSSSVTLTARCDMETDGGGWMVIQRRIANGTVNFTRDWNDYVNGFGDLNGEFWYGLDNIHYLTTRDDVELRIDMVIEDDGSELTWTYQTFTVAGANDKYRLTIGGGVGTGRDAMNYHNGQQFTTYDNDNDQWSGGNCAYRHQGGWWYNACYYANLNGPHDIPPKMKWYDGVYRDISSSEMKIRPKQCILAAVC